MSKGVYKSVYTLSAQGALKAPHFLPAFLCCEADAPAPAALLGNFSLPAPPAFLSAPAFLPIVAAPPVLDAPPVGFFPHPCLTFLGGGFLRCLAHLWFLRLHLTLSSSSVLLDSDPDRSQFVVGAGVGDGVGGSVGGGVGTASEVMSETASGTASGTALETASGKESGKESGKASAMVLETQSSAASAMVSGSCRRVPAVASGTASGNRSGAGW